MSVDFVVEAESGRLGPAVPPVALQAMRMRAVERCQEKYPSLGNTWEELVAEADRVLTDVVIDSRMANLYNMLTYPLPTTRGRGLGRSLGRGYGRRGGHGGARVPHAA